MNGEHRVLLVRHAEPAASARGRCYGSLDVPLSAAGRAQAAALAARLAGVTLATVVSSPRVRATETAAALGRDVELDDDLRELDFGTFEGRTYDEIAAAEPELYRRWMEAPTTVTFPGGESWPLLRARASAALERLRTRHPAGTVAVVTHGGVVRAALAEALGMPDEAIFRLAIDHARISVVERVGGTPVVRLVNGLAV